jgi:6-phosphogluconolactonase
MAKGNTMNFIEYPDREMLVLRVADALAGELENALLTHESVSFAVPGGTTPGPIFDILSATALDWQNVHVMLSDERWVPEDHDLSNTRLLRDRLFTGPAAAAQFVPFYRAGKTAAEGCAEVAATLSAQMPLSLLVLGIGTDMHTASLFPGAAGLEAALATDAPLLCPISPADQEIDRVTLSAHALRGALSTHVVMYGADKRAALETARSLPAAQAPIGAVLGNATVHWAA